MRVAMEAGWAVVVLPHGHRFLVRVWDRDRVRSVDGVHATFGPALREALTRACVAQDRQNQEQRRDRARDPDQEQDQDRGREQERPSGPALPSPELLATVLQIVTEAVA